MTNLTDEELVPRIVSGDRALFEVLMRRHNQRIYRAVRAVLRTDADAEDVMQEAYLSAYQHLHQFEGRAKFSTWLTRIAVNAALARRGKREGNGMTDSDDDSLEALESVAPDPEQETLATELREVMEREVAALPDSFRSTFVLREVEGLSTTETAEVLGISEDLVKTRLHRARTTLRDRLYQRAGITLESLFSFGNSRCDRVVAAVMERLR
ncbi:MAG TPA: RNA polymerase sigma factor [Thermoanaerobaculia bacterium]|nr:RNA polymerase sigma factor [Thermoanaerobaculia bacterium]